MAGDREQTAQKIPEWMKDSEEPAEPPYIGPPTAWAFDPADTWELHGDGPDRPGMFNVKVSAGAVGAEGRQELNARETEPTGQYEPEWHDPADETPLAELLRLEDRRPQEAEEPPVNPYKDDLLRLDLHWTYDTPSVSALDGQEEHGTEDPCADDEAGLPAPDWDENYEISSEVLETECAIANILGRREEGRLLPIRQQPSLVVAVPDSTGLSGKKPVRRETRRLKNAPDLPPPIDAKEVAYMALCSSKHIYDLCSQPGAIPHSRRRRRITFDRAEIQAWLDGFRVS
jgi:hypothetical protein